MIPAFLAAIVLGACGLLLEGLAEALVEGLVKMLLCGIGVAAIWLLTFGRIRLKILDDRQPETASTVGFVVLLLACSLS